MSSYVLVTAARNECRYIEVSIQSVIAQTKRPDKWVIVSDGSTDGTDDIVNRYVRRQGFMTLLRLEDRSDRNFASQATALNHGIAALRGHPHEFIGFIDADISVERDYYEQILQIFSKDDRLGLAGGYIYESNGRQYAPRRYNSMRSVAGAIQMFRRSCLDSIGDFTPLRHGGLDTVAEAKVRMLGYSARSFPHLKVYHHRRTSAGNGMLFSSYRAGLMDYEIGYDPVYEVFMCLRRTGQRSGILTSALCRLAGYARASLAGMDRLVPTDLIEFLRREQRERLRAFLRRPMLFRKTIM